MKVLLMVGSARASSLNKKIAQFVKSQFSDKGTFTIIDQLDLLPSFNPDLEQTTTHDYLNFMMAELKSADKVIFITPEYIHSMPGILKNAFDWIVGTAFLDRKSVALIVATSSSGEYVTKQVLEVLNVLTGSPVNSNQFLQLAPIKAYFDGQEFKTEHRSLFVPLLEFAN